MKSDIEIVSSTKCSLCSIDTEKEKINEEISKIFQSDHDLLLSQVKFQKYAVLKIQLRK